MAVICPYCTKEAKLVDSIIIYGKSYGMVWDCRPCDAYVGTHSNSVKNVPLGRLANKELRYWKKRAHACFDPLWKSGKFGRHTAYKIAREIMNMTSKDCHIGKFDIDQCKKLIEGLRNFDFKKFILSKEESI